MAVNIENHFHSKHRQPDKNESTLTELLYWKSFSPIISSMNLMWIEFSGICVYVEALATKNLCVCSRVIDFVHFSHLLLSVSNL